MISFVLFPQALKPSVNCNNLNRKIGVLSSTCKGHGLYLNTVRHKLHEHVPSRRWNRIYRQSFGRHLETCRT